MSEEVIMDIARDAIYTIILTSAPPLVVSLVIGLIVSIFQTVTSIQEQTLTFVPKIIGVFLSVMLLGSWMLNNMADYMIELFNNVNLYL